jgi:putative spermidine/putrescine transport system substrate-binding protein
LSACDGNELLGPDGCATNGRDNFDRIKFWQTPTEDCLGAGGTCVPYYKWVTDYLAVIGGR